MVLVRPSRTFVSVSAHVGLGFTLIMLGSLFVVVLADSPLLQPLVGRLIYPTATLGPLPLNRLTSFLKQLANPLPPRPYARNPSLVALLFESDL